jgi:hypothetical protein
MVNENYIRNSFPLVCDNDSIMLDGKCRKKCLVNFEDQGTLCVKNCPANLKSTPTHCLKNPPEFLGKEYNTLGECNRENMNGCYKEGLQFYPICPDNKKQVGNHCVDKCDNMLDQGFGCRRTNYIKGIGKVLDNQNCPENMERIGDTCYEKCLDGYKSNGVFCIKE